jgi:predicted dehydrogenase
VDELLDDPEVDIVLDLASPPAHPAINAQALRSGKHVYTEKPFALTRADADEVINLARERNLRVGSAPDTFLGGGLQTCRKLIDEGAIGVPYGASGTILMGSLYDTSSPRFETYLQPGWDPLYDMAPYYLTAMIFLLGPVRKVAGLTAQLHREVTVANPESPSYGKTVPVNAPMNAATTLEFESGVIATLQLAKESFGYNPRFEIYGTEGILYAPDPNAFGGPIVIQRPNKEFVDIPLSHGFTDNSRGIGVADMAYAIRSGRPHRANDQLASHVLDITLSIFESARTERHVAVPSRCERPSPLPPEGLDI